MLIPIVGGCYATTEDLERAQLVTLGERTVEIVDNLRAAGYPDEEIEIEEDGTVYVGLDAEVGLEASREMIGIADRRGEVREGAEQGFRQYRTANLISSSIGTICVDGSSYSGTLGAALDQAIGHYNALDLSFEMVRTSGSSSGCDATIEARVTNGDGGIAGFPSGGMPYPAINIGTVVASYGTSVASHVIQHELGHCLGFRHTDYFDRSISCGTGGNEGQSDVGAIHIPGTPTGAVLDGSVMNSCFNGGSTGQWTTSDVTALTELYGSTGAPPPPPLAGDDTCEGRCGGYDPAQSCQCDDACIDHDDCCGDVDEVCAPAEPPPPPAEPQPGPNSCAQACGGNAGECWCDNLCASYGDCCDDIAAHC